MTQSLHYCSAENRIEKQYKLIQLICAIRAWTLLFFHHHPNVTENTKVKTYMYTLLFRTEVYPQSSRSTAPCEDHRPRLRYRFPRIAWHTSCSIHSHPSPGSPQRHMLEHGSTCMASDITLGAEEPHGVL